MDKARTRVFMTVIIGGCRGWVYVQNEGNCTKSPWAGCTWPHPQPSSVFLHIDKQPSSGDRVTFSSSPEIGRLHFGRGGAGDVDSLARENNVTDAIAGIIS